MLFDRRTFLLSGAALGACATGAPLPTPEADAAFVSLAEVTSTQSPGARWQAIRAFDARALTPQGRILYEAIRPGAEADAQLARLPYGADAAPYALSHRYGRYRAANADPAEIMRETQRLHADAALGVVAPDFVIDATLPLVQASAARAAGPLAEALHAQTGALSALRARAGGEAGVWRLPQGEEFYHAALQFHLGAAVDPAAAHAQAQALAAALQREADAILRTLSLNEGDVGTRLRTLARDPLYQIKDRDAAVADMRATLDLARTLCAPAFTVPLPEAEIRALAPAEEADGARGRREGGVYLVDLGGARPRWTLPSVVFHETIPGHAMQAQTGGALQRRYAGGYGEGWAIYAEMLADELGGFADNRLSQLGYLQWMLFRMARIVGDTGMHALRWSRARTVDEMRAIQGDSIAFVSIEEDVVRIAAQPGVAAAQGLAALHISALRARQRARDPQFLARFHAAMLRHGPLSPPGLEQAARAEWA